MARGFLITGTGARVGKTTVGCALGFAMRARGIRVGVMKPVDTLDHRRAIIGAGGRLRNADGVDLPVSLSRGFRTGRGVRRSTYRPML